jgi:hypothetical protein
MRKVVPALAAVFTSFAFAGHAGYAAPVGCDIENNGTGSGTSTVPVPGGSTFIIDGTIQTTALGPGTFHGEGVQTGPTSFTHTSATRYRGGTVTQTGSGTNTGPDTTTVINTITGGTGRFRAVTGTSIIMSVGASTSDPQVSTFTLTFTGTVHLAHGPCGHSTS